MSSTTLMFWNLYYSGRSLLAGDPQPWNQQVAVVRRHQPDILAITEGWEWHREALLDRARLDHGYDDARLYESKTGCHMAVLVRSGFTFASTRGQPQAQAFWHGFFLTRLTTPSGGGFDVLVSHLNPFDPTLRRIEGSWLRQQMARQHRRLLVMDANAIPPGDDEPPPLPSQTLPGDDHSDRAPLQGLSDIGLVDVGAHFGDRRPTFGYYHDPDEPSRPDTPGPDRRLDQAWATPDLSLTGYGVLDADPETATASDHRPILVELDLDA